MKKYTLSLLILFLFNLNSFAQNLKGIIVESPCERVVVFFNNERVSDPVESCMVANLSPGYYYIEAFALDARGRYNRSVYSKRIYFDGNGLTKIELLDDSFVGVVPHAPSLPVLPPLPPAPEPYYGNEVVCFEPMNDEAFNKMLSAINNAAFKSDKLAVIDLVADEVFLTVDQLGRVMDQFSFDDEKLSAFKKFYANVVDKENLFTLLDKLSFGNSKTKMRNYIQEQKKNRGDRNF